MNPPPGRPLRGLLVAQFFGAFNDNAWKMVVALLAIRSATAGISSSDPSFELISQTQTTWAFVIFTLPLCLFSLPAGLLADRFSKRTVIISLKMVEVVLMVAGMATLAWSEGPTLPLVVLGLMGMQAALFSPAKYGILPELLPHEELSAGNGTLELWTFVAIIGGTGAGGLLLDLAGTRTWIAGLLLTVMAIIGFAASFWIPAVPPARSEGGLVQTLQQGWAAVRNDRVLWLSMLGSVLFWAVISLLGQDVLVYAKSLTKAWSHSDTLSGLPMAFYGIGVGFGCMIAARISGHKVEYGLLPLGAIGLAFFTTLLGILGPGYTWTLVIMIFAGASSGFVVVPIDSILQWRSPAAIRGAVIALVNVFVFGGVLIGSLGAGLMANLGLGPQGIMIFAGLVTIGGTLWAIYLLPDFLIRLIFVLLTQTFYRLTVTGQLNIPREGGALLVPNHVSFIDGFLIIASTDRQVRFLVDEIYYFNPFLNPLMKAMHAIPVSATGGMRVILRALRDAGKCLDEGDVVCIFPEGQITRTGMMLPFRRGLERIIKGRNAPIIPVVLDRVWGSLHTRPRGRLPITTPHRYPYPITVAFGQPLPATTPAEQIRQVVQDLTVSAWAHRKADAIPLHHSFIRRMRTSMWRFALGDATRKLSRFSVLSGSIALARALQPTWEGQTHVGILLPPSIGAALANLAGSLSGRVTVNLNFTSGKAGLESAAKQAGLQTILTNREFLEKAKIELPEGTRIVYLEDIMKEIGVFSRLLAAFLAVTTPVRLLERLCGASRPVVIDDVATIIFSSGSTGEPKGVMLTHYNISSNVQGVGQVLCVDHYDRLLGVLPLFHSFGYMALWFSLEFGMGIIFHANPLDAAKIGQLAEEEGITFLIATPTFLQIYMRRCAPGQFGSVRLVFTGAEKLTERTALAFEEKFGIRPIEGYGATECAPAITVSTLDFRGQGIYQVGSKRGSVGHPVPGVSVKVVDPDSLDPLPLGQPGMLLVKGPNVMKGYLGRDDLTAKVMRDGWYITGDIAILDENGFVKITDRLSRFSKIGGEMIPHGKVEDALHQAIGSDVQVFAVTAIPDERKGESLAVLHTIDPARIPEIGEKLVASGLPNLFIPKKENYIRVEKIPVLGTGKIDLRAVKKTAMDTLLPGGSKPAPQTAAPVAPPSPGPAAN